MSSPSSATMCTSTDDCFCHEQVRQSRSRYSACTQRRMSSALIASKSSSGSGGALAKQHLLQRVAPAPFGDHLPGAGRELLLDPLDPLVRGVHDVGVLRSDLGEHGEVAGEVSDQLELALARQVDDAVRDLHMRQAELLQPAFVLVD